MTMQIKSAYFWLFFVSHLICSSAQFSRWFGDFWPQSSISCIDSNGDESRIVANLTSCTFTLPLEPLVKKIEDFTEDEAEDLVYVVDSVWTGDYTIQFDKRSWILTWDDQANSIVSTQLSTLTPSSDNLLGSAIESEVKKDVDSFGRIEMRNLPGNFEVDEALDRYLFTDNARFSLTLKNSEINLSASNIELILKFEQ